MTPRTRIIVGAMSIATLFGGATARAQTNDLRAVIPFEFRAGETMLPSGTYMVKRGLGSGSAVQLRTVRGGVIFMTGPAATGKDGAATQLTFNKYGDSYFLHAIRFAQDREYTLPASKAEREIVRESADKGRESPIVVTVTAVR
jgi:hypothetical protein